MSIVVSETSPRALLDSAIQLSYTLNLLAEDQTAQVAYDRGPGFILKEVENILLQIRKDLDVPYATPATEDTPALMMRLRAHIDSISSVLTGNTVRFATADSTTLHELIDSLAVLNTSVSCRKESIMGCTTQ